MKTCPEQIVHQIHAYLDGDLSQEEEDVLMSHLEQCSECNELMEALEDSITFIEQAESVVAPEGFVANVMSQLPKEKKQVKLRQWLRRQPVLVAAAMFIMLMSVSLFSNYDNDQQFSVTKQPNLVVNGEVVTVPKGEVIEGDVIVKNGTLHIEGEVNGDITVINGSKYMASTAVVTGEVEQIDKAFDWLWYTMKSFIKDIIPAKSVDE